jgi:lysozyme
MRAICAPGPVTKLIDIYHGDYISDINQVIGSGVVGAYLKAWEYSEDSSFSFRWNALKGKMLRGAYDFFHPDMSAVDQANSFLKVVGPLDVGDLPHMLDWESSGGTSALQDRNEGLAWLETVEKASGKTPIIYGSPYFLQALGLDDRFKRFPLYVAEYGVKCPLVPPPWDVWSFWQTSESGRVPGIRGPCDTDVFNGSLDDLKAFIKNSAVGQNVTNA